MFAFAFFDSGEAYRFFSANTNRYGRVVTTENAARWRHTAWRPGDTLVWTLDTSADWSLWFGSSAGARPALEKALAAWSDIPNADISWELADEAASDYGATGPRDRTRNWVSIDPIGEFGGQARMWWGRAGAEWQIDQCTIVGGSRLAEEPPDWFKELEEDDPERMYPALGMWIHEFGHCLGLHHSQRLPTRRLPVRRDSDTAGGRPDWYRVMQSDAWVADPQMSYGWSDFGLEHPVTADDAAGARLLRPGRGWLRTTGAISGSLVMEGRPARYVHVWAFPADAMTGVGQPSPVGVFSDREGNFLIEGLAPGEYVLWVSPMTERPAHFWVAGQAGPSVADETVVPYPVRVTAGSVTESISIALRRGRECRPPAPCGIP
ncbi:MAG: carboxypeptidase regulatory-like domain-containing protein [Rhodospirillales bacterium]|nr:carboxypeptidase regulatory-like domain-containing protein [Rhodospirillales bacterium]